MCSRPMRDLKMNENKDVACFFVTKHSWKGKYKRIFSVGTLGITTYNPTTMESTNQWAYKEFLNITPNTKNNLNNEFVITMKKGRKNDTMRFSSDHRADILTEALVGVCSALLPGDGGDSGGTACKLVSSGGGFSLEEAGLYRRCLKSRCDVANNYHRTINILAYKLGILEVSSCDLWTGVVVQHLFITDRRDEIMRLIVDAAAAHIGVPIKIKKDDLTLEDFIENKFGKFRDALLASLLDGVRASGNKDVHVKMKFTNRGQRLGPLTSHMDEEVESNHLKFLHTSFLP
ncbi:DNAJC13, partial [Cordylochernes scorpioides]